MAGWIEKNGLQPVGTVYEHYYNGPEYPESELLTMIVMPVLQASNIPPHPVLRRRPTPHPVAPGC
ncbi:hypothetical protein [Methanoculleus chikugoensis]|uniref:hypothetical protein n=1 Tax=Methanoculleus chikugoensis TaxID=118126 RepID=UPI000B19B6D1|nr:hypothetical protein [Methanoculleus chikugoensis]